MGKKCFALLVSSILIFSSGVCFAQEGTENLPAKEAESIEYSYGQVIAQDELSNKITVLERNWDDEGEMEIIYLVPSGTKVENGGSVNEIPAGTEVDIAYTKGTKGARILKHIRIYEKEFYEEEE